MRAITPMKDDLARKMRATAASVDKTHPETVAGQHLRNAAMLVQHGQGDGAKRHLDAAMELMTPRNLIRHGITDDEGHATAKAAMHQMNVHRLGVMDIQDAQARNSQQATAKKQATDQQAQAKQAAAATKKQAATPPAPGQQGNGGGQQNQPPGKQPAGGNQQPGQPSQQASATSNSWPTPILAQQFSNVDLSARTAMLEHTPAPYGKPGGPGLYGKAGNKHSDYFEQIVTALMAKRGMDKATASRIAWGALRKWRAGGGHVHPEVQAAASGALVKEAAAGARSALAGDWDTVDRLIELAQQGAQQGGGNSRSQNAQSEARVPKGQPGGGQFGSGSGGGKQPGGKGTRAQRRARLVKQAVTLRGEIAQLLAQIHSASHPGKSRSSTPAKKGAAATSAKQAAASKSASSTPAKSSSTAKAASAKTPTLSQMRTRLAALRAQLHTVMGEVHQLANEERAAIELAGGYKDAWRHELRGPHGQFVSGAGGTRLPAGRARAAARRHSSLVGVRPAGTRPAPGRPQPLHPEVENRVKEIAAQLDTDVQQAAAKDAAAKAKDAADQAHQALVDTQNKMDKAETHSAMQKAAVEGGITIAALVLSWIEAKLGAPGIMAMITAPSVTMVQILIEWAKKL